eukprot:gene7936-9466_t
MSTCTDLVGRLAQLRNIVTKPELNGLYVLVQAYLQEKNRFLVETLSHPVVHGGEVKIAVKAESLQLTTESSFFDWYPRQPEVKLQRTEHLPDLLQDGIILDVSGVQPSVQQISLVFVHSHRMFGDKKPLESKGIPHPRTTLTDNFLIVPPNEQSIIEFEDIRFVGLHAKTMDIFFCVKGHCTTFRHCLFQNIFFQVAGSDPEITANVTSRIFGEKCVGTPQVVFESCIFENETLKRNSNGVIVSHDGSITLINCVFRNCEFAVEVREEGHATMVHCTIENSFVGVKVVEKAKGVSMHNCTVSSCELYGILLDWAGEVSISGCKVENCICYGIEDSNRNRRAMSINIDDCHIAKCEYGINFEIGGYLATISNTTVQNNDKVGIIVLPSVMGNIALKQCRVTENGQNDVINLSQVSSAVRCDGRWCYAKIHSIRL